MRRRIRDFFWPYLPARWRETIIERERIGADGRPRPLGIW